MQDYSDEEWEDEGGTAPTRSPRPSRPPSREGEAAAEIEPEEKVEEAECVGGMV